MTGQHEEMSEWHVANQVRNCLPHPLRQVETVKLGDRQTNLRNDEIHVLNTIQKRPVFGRRSLTDRRSNFQQLSTPLKGDTRLCKDI